MTTKTIDMVTKKCEFCGEQINPKENGVLIYKYDNGFWHIECYKNKLKGNVVFE